MYELVQREGYKVDYARLAITDEQAPVPAVFSQLEERVITALQTGSLPAFSTVKWVEAALPPAWSSLARLHCLALWRPTRGQL